MEDYVSALGKIIGNLHALEFSLRAFLFHRDPRAPFPPGTTLGSLRVGDVVPENAFTNYDTLGVLIAKYNEVVEPPRRIDQSLAELRDALAHGRVSSERMDFPLRLVKFNKPVNGSATATWSQELSEGWLAEQRKRLFQAVMMVSTGKGPPA